jgi:hypothetical protein
MHARSLHTSPCLGDALTTRRPETPRKRFIDDLRALTRPMRVGAGWDIGTLELSATTHSGGLFRTRCVGIAESVSGSVSKPHWSKGAREQ